MQFDMTMPEELIPVREAVDTDLVICSGRLLQA